MDLHHHTEVIQQVFDGLTFPERMKAIGSWEQLPFGGVPTLARRHLMSCRGGYVEIVDDPAGDYQTTIGFHLYGEPESEWVTQAINSLDDRFSGLLGGLYASYYMQTTCLEPPPRPVGFGVGGLLSKQWDDDEGIPHIMGKLDVILGLPLTEDDRGPAWTNTSARSLSW